jgi:hypothetical protein
MSNAHAYMDPFDQAAPASARSLKDAIVSLRVSATDLVLRVATGFRYRRTMDGMSRLSDHRLRDMGFERDWDASILPIATGQKASR